jgi:hypothetical protein
MRVSRLLDPVSDEVPTIMSELTKTSVKASAIGPAIFLEYKAAQDGRADSRAFPVLCLPQS